MERVREGLASELHEDWSRKGGASHFSACRSTSRSGREGEVLTSGRMRGGRVLPEGLLLYFGREVEPERTAVFVSPVWGVGKGLVRGLPDKRGMASKF